MSTPDRQAIEQTIQTYFDGLYEGNADKLASVFHPGSALTYEHKGVQYIAIMYGVGGWPGVGLVFDLQDPTAGLGAVGAFKNLAHYTQMGGGLMVFSLDGKGPYDDPMVGEYAPDQKRADAAQ